MAVTLTASGGTSSGTSGNTPTSAAFNLPTWSVGANDWILIYSVVEFSTNTFTTPTGYTAGPAGSSSANAVSLGLFYKQAVSGDSGASVSIPYVSASKWAVSYRVYSGCAGVDVSAGHDIGTASTTVTFGAVTPTAANEPVVLAAGARAASNGGTVPSFTAPSGYAHSVNDSTSAGGSINVDVGVFDLLSDSNAASTPYTPPSGTDGVSVGAYTITVALKVAASGTQYNQSAAATPSTTGALVNQISKTFTPTVASAGGLFNRIGRTVAAGAASSATVQAVRTRLQTAAASVASSVTMQSIRSRLQTVLASATSSISLVRQISKTSTATVASSPTLQTIRSRFLTVAAAVTSSATALATKVRLLVLAATVTSSSRLVRQVGKIALSGSITTSTMGRQVGKIATAVSTVASSLGPFHIGKLLVVGRATRLLDRTDLVYASEIGQNQQNGAPVVTPSSGIPALVKAARIPVIRFCVGDTFTDLLDPQGHPGTVLRSDFDAAIQGITNTLGAVPWLKMLPIASTTINGKPGDLWCPAWTGDASGNLPTYKAVLQEVVNAGYTGPIIIESNNEMEFDCWQLWQSQGASITSAGSTGVSARIGQHYAATMPALKKYARSLGFSDVVVGGYIGVSGGPQWGQSVTPDNTQPYGYSCQYESLWATEFNTSVYNAYVANGYDPDYIPDFLSIHAYPHGADFSTLSAGYEFDDNMAYAYYRNWIIQSRSVVNSIWGTTIGNRMRFAISEWNAGQDQASDTWVGWSIPGRVDSFYRGWFGMLQGNGVMTGTGTKYWEASCFELGSESNPGTSQYYNLINEDGTFPTWYNTFKASSTGDTQTASTDQALPGLARQVAKTVFTAIASSVANVVTNLRSRFSKSTTVTETVSTLSHTVKISSEGHTIDISPQGYTITITTGDALIENAAG